MGRSGGLPRRAGHAWLWSLCVVLLCLAGAPAAVATPSAEYQIKAAYLLNFAATSSGRRRGWRRAALRVCVLGRDPFGGALSGSRGAR
jgi:hypothetical protein